ncbi:MAG: Hpt domain-containing protein [Maritimibacter sp.]
MIDWERVTELKDEIGEEDFDEVVEMFLSEVEEVIDRLKTAPDPATYEADLHFLKSSSLNLGFDALSKICNAGERSAAQGHAADVALAPVFSCFEESRQALSAGPTG